MGEAGDGGKGRRGEEQEQFRYFTCAFHQPFISLLRSFLSSLHHAPILPFGFRAKEESHEYRRIVQGGREDKTRVGGLRKGEREGKGVMRGR